MEEVVVSGMRPTGKLHLGHLHGVLTNWVQLQSKYRCFFFVADWHALTTEFEDTRGLQDSVVEMVIDWLTAGLDPEKSVIFLQSDVKQHAELHLLFSMITPLGWLERNPSYKDLLSQLPDKDLSMYGFLGYPVLQTADVVLYKATKVPVGVDQVAHLELAREIVRRFNHLFKLALPEPQPMLTEVPKLLGTDGRKMSKSFNNAIYLSDPPDVVEKKVRSMVTDTRRIRKTDPGHPEECVLFPYHKLHTPAGEVARIDKDCRSATLGCVEDKGLLIESLKQTLGPFQQKRKIFESDRNRVMGILRDGAARARVVAEQTMQDVRRAVMSTS
ncbi:MAG: tryptophan--tRNA ligase [Nitrospirae bacterium]|nr:tryptophan--tRNA ligase [Nitrospirota bacterium]